MYSSMIYIPSCTDQFHFDSLTKCMEFFSSSFKPNRALESFKTIWNWNTMRFRIGRASLFVLLLNNTLLSLSFECIKIEIHAQKKTRQWYESCFQWPSFAQHIRKSIKNPNGKMIDWIWLIIIFSLFFDSDYRHDFQSISLFSMIKGKG